MYVKDLFSEGICLHGYSIELDAATGYVEIYPTLQLALNGVAGYLERNNATSGAVVLMTGVDELGVDYDAHEPEPNTDASAYRAMVQRWDSEFAAEISAETSLMCDR